MIMYIVLVLSIWTVDIGLCSSVLKLILTIYSYRGLRFDFQSNHMYFHCIEFICLFLTIPTTGQYRTIIFSYSQGIRIRHCWIGHIPHLSTEKRDPFMICEEEACTVRNPYIHLNTSNTVCSLLNDFPYLFIGSLEADPLFNPFDLLPVKFAKAGIKSCHYQEIIT